MAKETKESVTVETEAVTANTKPELVPLTINITEKDQDDVFIGVNGKSWVIQRGVEVMVPKIVKEVWDNSMRMDEEALRRKKNLPNKQA